LGKNKGYVLNLKLHREDAFVNNQYDTFGEPVPEFSHSRNIPLICFIINSNNLLTHIALGKRGSMAGTDVRRLNLSDIFELRTKVYVDSLIDKSPKNLKKRVIEKLNVGGVVPPKSLEFLIREISNVAPETAIILSKYSEARSKRIEGLSSKVKDALAEQKEAVATAMTIAGIDRGELRGWDISDDKKPTSFLDGLEQVRLREDPMIINDLRTLPGFATLKSTPFSSVVFENDKSKLTVVLANRLPLEKQFGVDLIYYNETFCCFLMIQYKAMEKEGPDDVYRFPNGQLSEEIDRMDSVTSELVKVRSNSEADGYRLSEDPFFLKICPRIVFQPDDISLIKGMYLPLEYWKMLSIHPDMIGPKGGKRLSYKNVRRYFNNTEFVTLAAGGWVGTNIEQSKLLEKAIQSTLESGRAVVFAVNNEKDKRHRNND
jgi:hypothetical protein